MGDRRNRIYTMTGPDQFDPTFPVFDNTFQMPYVRPTGHPTHLNGMNYWYRAEPQDNGFEHNKILYNQSMPIPHNQLEQAVAIKHRRTRSGCFTCRHRRVKCDETRPICERCKKGNRECQFPQLSSSSRRIDSTDMRNGISAANMQEGKAETSQNPDDDDNDDEDDDEDNEEEELEATKEGSVSPMHRFLRTEPSASRGQFDTSRAMNNSTPKQGQDANNRQRGSPRSTGMKSPQYRTGTPASSSQPPAMTSRPPPRPPKWKHLSSVMQHYLQFHFEKITRYHYFLKLDPTDFIHHELIEMALTFEPLLHAVVAFAAYHYALSKPNGRFQDFWKYYCESVMQLRKWLESHTERNEAVLLTILQLATFEEYLGDWAGLASHLKAAYSIFSTHYTYENLMTTVTSRCIFDWLSRGDIAVSLMAGAPTVLDRQWFTVALDWHEEQAEIMQPDPDAEVHCLIAKLRLLGFDMAKVHSNAANSPTTANNIREITSKTASLRHEIQALCISLQPATSPISGRMGRSNSRDTTDRDSPVLHGELWPLNFLWIDWYATEQMHRYRTLLFAQASSARSLARQPARQISASTAAPRPSLDDIPPEFEKLSLIQCQIFEAIEQHPQAPSGAILSCQASLALASVFLKKIPKHTVWARRKLAKMERLGYVWPPSFRKRMAELWDDEDVLDWWLPGGEYRIDLLDEIRGVVEERNKEIDARGGDEREDVREMKAVFDKLDFRRRGGLRARKDSVWSAAGTEGGGAADSSTKMSSTDSSDEDEDEDDENGEEDDGQAAAAEADTDEEDDDSESAPTTAASATKRSIQSQRSGKPSNQTRSRDGGSNATSTSNNNHRHQQHHHQQHQQQRVPQTLEYSNRMSGIWEG